MSSQLPDLGLNS